MGHTRAVKIKNEKLNIDQMLAMVQHATDNGFMTPQAILLDCSSKQQIAYMVDKRLIEPVQTSHGVMFRATFKTVEQTITIGTTSATSNEYVSTQG